MNTIQQIEMMLMAEYRKRRAFGADEASARRGTVATIGMRSGRSLPMLSYTLAQLLERLYNRVHTTTDVGVF
jgi:hypothetical protein